TGGAPPGASRAYLRSAIQETVEQFPVGLHDAAEAIANTVEILEDGDAEQFAGMHRSRGHHVVHTPHGACQAGFSENPAAAQAADAVHLGEAAGDYKFGTEVKRRARRVFIYRVEIDLVDQYSGADIAGDFADLAEDALGRQHARRIVQV